MSSASMLRAARQRAGLSQRQLAQRAGTSQPAVARYEAGRAEPRVDTLERLLAACGSRLSTKTAPARRESIPAEGPKGRLLRRRRGLVLEAVDSLGLRNPRVFGSVARGEDHAESDIDLLVDLGEDGDVLAIYELRDLLTPILGSVDVACTRVLRPDVLLAAETEAIRL